jgi:hypothetical protein
MKGVTMGLKRRPPEGNVRRVTSIGQNSPGNMTNKAGHVVQFESFAEHGHLLGLDRDPTVKDYRSQPIRFTFFDSQNKEHSYVPDFMVWKHDGQTEIHEITRTERQNRLSINLRQEAAQNICREKGWRYLVYTERSLPQRTEITNLFFLYAYRPTTYANNVIADAIIQQLDKNERQSLRGLVNEFAQTLNLSDGVILPAIYHLLWHGKVITDLQTPISLDGLPSSRVTVWLP